ncbi:MAG: anthranilate synthase component I family protein [Oscillospiraceae bacterium]|nr:anthranilate synthase component I family protein [Oscillospiraceae bacterium]
MISPALDEAKRLSEGKTIVPIALEMFSDVKTPIEILRNIRKTGENWFILESVNDGGDGWGRYTFLGCAPSVTISGTNGIVTVKDGTGKHTVIDDPVKLIRQLLGDYKSPRIPSLPPFTGGLVGYFSYDFAQHFIPGLKLKAADSDGFDDFNLMLVDKVIAFDHFRQKIYLIVNVAANDLDNSYIKGVQDLKDMEQLVLRTAAGDESSSSCGEFSSAFSEAQFAQMVNKVKDHIYEGDIFQAVISNRFTAPFDGDLLQTYRLLRTTNPSPYMVYMRLSDIEIACSSPETLVSLRDGEVSSFPLAGTCPRGKTLEEDKALETALLNDEKELSEHDMLVDLARNDVGRVSRFGSVRIPEYREIKRFSHVSHISTRVVGELQDGLDAIDVIASALPAGTLSGAPKKRACEIIDNLEGIKRGVYGGALGYIDFTGNMDMCIGIRMAVLKNSKVFVQAGAGIVAESEPDKEYQETLNKSQAVIDALKNSGRI